MTNKEAIKEIQKWLDGCPFEDTKKAFDLAIKALERPQGEWIEVPVKRDILHPNGIKYVCSACKSDNCCGKPPFCMWCGATMKSEEEEQHESQ